MCAALKRDAGVDDQVLDRARDEHLARSSLRGDSRVGMHRDAGNLAVDCLALPRVQPGANLQPELLYRVDDGAGAADRTRGSLERGVSPAMSTSTPLKRTNCRRTRA